MSHPPRSLRQRRRWSIALGTILGLTLALIGLAYGWLVRNQVLPLPLEQLSVITQFRPQDNSLVFDKDGRQIGEYFSSYHIFAPFEAIPKPMVQAIVAIEDRHFWLHKGFDPIGIGRAVIAYLNQGQAKQGASTLSQQVVRHFLLTKERKIARKVKEIFLAYHLEQEISKEKILEIYANALFLGHGAYGVGAAAHRYFGKALRDLTLAETALIAGLFQSPSRFNPMRFPKQAKARQEMVLKAMRREGMISPEEYAEARNAPLTYSQYRPMNAQFAPYFLDYVREEAARLLGGDEDRIASGGLRIYTTLDPVIQNFAESALNESQSLIEGAASRVAQINGKKARLEAAILSVDPTSGAIRAMIGGLDYNQSKWNRTHQALRSPGSAFKPVVFSLALQSQWKWSDVIYVSPITIQNYRPRTPDQDFLTETTLLRAFYRSMNTPTVELGEKLGLDAVIKHAQNLGIKSPIKREFGSMLGSSDTTMMDMARVYGTFASGGQRVDPVAITAIKDRDGKVLYTLPDATERKTTVLSPEQAFLMTGGMRAVLAVGTGSAASDLSDVAAGKTGTSNDSTDNWFCGYSPQLVSIVWVGTDEHAEIFGDMTGGKIALPIWKRLMTKAIDHDGRQPFVIPPGITSYVVHPQFGHQVKDGVRMYFPSGGEPPSHASPLEDLAKRPSDTYREVFTH